MAKYSSSNATQDMTEVDFASTITVSPGTPASSLPLKGSLKEVMAIPPKAMEAIDFAPRSRLSCPG